MTPPCKVKARMRQMRALVFKGAFTLRLVQEPTLHLHNSENECLFQFAPQASLYLTPSPGPAIIHTLKRRIKLLMIVVDPVLSGFSCSISPCTQKQHKRYTVSSVNIKANPPLPWLQLKVCGYMKGHRNHLSTVCQNFRTPCDTSAFPNTSHLLSFLCLVPLFCDCDGD